MKNYNTGNNGYNFLYSTATERFQVGIELLIAGKIARHILHIKSISKRLLLVTIDCNPKITIICAYTPREEASASNKDTFYNNLTDCLRDILLHNFIVLMGDLNARVESSNTHLKAVERYTYHQLSNDNGNRLKDLCEANNMSIATTRKPHPNRHKWSCQHPNGNKAQLDHAILRRKWISSH